MSERIRVCIADDHAVVRQGLHAFLASQPDIEVVGEASTGAQAVDLVRELRPGVLLIDLLMPVLDGFEATRQVRATFPETAVIILTAHAAEGQVLRALRAGALSYLLKDSEAHEIAAAIRRAARGEASLAPALRSRALQKLAGRASDHADGLAQLTNRELEVLRLIADGLSNAVIAERLVITEGTVKTHVTNILGKLQLDDRTQAAALAWQRGIVDPADGRSVTDRMEAGSW
jgi:NarL family two-component system response regulator LiaR